MNKEIKKQLIISSALLCMLFVTLISWYDNFMFHTYTNVSSYQYCFSGENDDFIIDGYEFYQNGSNETYGNARLLALKDQMLLKGDSIQTTLSFISHNKKTVSFEQSYQVRLDNEVCFFDELETKQSIHEKEFQKVEMTIKIKRNKKLIYDETLSMKQNHIVAYNGSNKDYSVQNVYVSSSWLKTGTFSSTISGIEEKYPYMTIDYLYANDTSTKDINRLERFVLLKGKTEDMLNGTIQKTSYFDHDGSLLEKPLYCVVTLAKDESLENAYTFMLELHGMIKVVTPDE